MGERLPRVTGKEVLSALLRLGFSLHHVRGSHHVLRNGARHVTVPVHAGGIIGPGLLRRIFEQAGVSEDDFRGAL
jgi:predicted RNA binding protein YcfA (HicA-like mRNA interferase family)